MNESHDDAQEGERIEFGLDDRLQESAQDWATLGLGTAGIGVAASQVRLSYERLRLDRDRLDFDREEFEAEQHRDADPPPAPGDASPDG